MFVARGFMLSKQTQDSEEKPQMARTSLCLDKNLNNASELVAIDSISQKFLLIVRTLSQEILDPQRKLPRTFYSPFVCDITK